MIPLRVADALTPCCEFVNRLAGVVEALLPIHRDASIHKETMAVTLTHLYNTLNIIVKAVCSLPLELFQE
jgi:hypothetical protein